MRAMLCAAATVMLAQEVTLPSALLRAGEYVTEFQRQLAGIVAEEHYIQNATTPPVRPLLLRTTEHRELRSDLLLVKPAGVKDWVQFRDVFEVDGAPVRDRAERLTKLFVQPSAQGHALIETILNESARYNAGAIERNVNAPVLPLKFLEPANQRRFRFKRATDRVPAVTRTDAAAPGVFRVSAEVWAIAYEEKERPTIIRTTNKKSLPASGRFWIEPETGRVLMSEMILEDRYVRAAIAVSYQSEPLLGFLVPIEMREQYDGRRDKSHVDGVATYGRFRQFQVNTNETFLIKK